jgi:cytochrome c biogenesis protein
VIAGNLDTVTLYDSSGQFAGVRRPGSGKPITVDGLTFVVEDIVGSTGLEIKADPGVPWVYAGFGGLMITTLVSYVSHSQVWALQEGSSVYVAGKTNRAKVTFEQELDDVMDSVPEVQPQQQAGAAASS